MSAANPYPVVDRIPEDQPFLVWRNRRKTIVGLVVVLICSVPLIALAGYGVFTAFDNRPSIVLLVILIPSATIVVLQSLRALNGGPLLAVGPAGLWIKTRPGGKQAIWLPWESIAMITRDSRRLNFTEADRTLVVTPADPRATQGLGGSWLRSAPDRFTATLKHADRKEPEILEAVAYYAANRVPLG